MYICWEPRQQFCYRDFTNTISAQFRQHLVTMIEFYEELEPVDPDHLVQGELRSEVMFKEDKKYHVDLKASGIYKG